ncbi:MAG: IS66 family transposase [Prevotellaceae bacterium]|jgi:hypothetical protein|nr:IS66 family transposase [Prevotellaceae bacterium]
MKPLTRIQQLEKQNKDLRVRIDNRQGKAEIALNVVKDENTSLKLQLSTKGKAIVMLQAGMNVVTEENEKLKKENGELKDALDKANDRVAKLEAMLKKDSTNSSKPPSTDSEFTKAKADSNKEKSGKAVGGQPGHKGHYLLPSPEPDNIVDKKPPSVCSRCGGDVIFSDKYEARQNKDFEVIVTIREERVYHGRCVNCKKKYKGEFSEGFNSHAGYGANVKAATAMLNTDANVPVHKTALFISCLTEGKINMSDGTVVNITAELAAKFMSAVQEIVILLASCGVLNVDETGVRVNGKLTWMQIISNENYSLYARSLKRGTLNDEMESLIMLFTGVLVHDHLSSYYGYTHLSHAECNVHILRYLKAVTEIMHHPWAKDLAGLLVNANNQKKELLKNDITKMKDEDLEEIRERFTTILDQGQKEYDAAIEGKTNITYYEEECRLLNRLRKYIDEHLRFLCDFAVPFSNNVAEHGARHIKGKKKTSGGFRSDSGVDNYAVIASVVATLRKQRKHVYTAMRNAFKGKPPKIYEPVIIEPG